MCLRKKMILLSEREATELTYLFSLNQPVCVRRHFKNIFKVGKIENGFDRSARAGQGKSNVALSRKLECLHEGGYSRAVNVGYPRKVHYQVGHILPEDGQQSVPDLWRSTHVEVANERDDKDTWFFFVDLYVQF